jgi:GNAT superfamily N-acetyltransferase
MISDGSVQVVFRSARAEDADAVVSLVESAYRGEPSRQGWTTEADLLDGQRTDRGEVDALLGDARATIVLAAIEGQLAGCVCVRLDPPELAHVGMFAVRPGLQSRGLGRALLSEAERVARERGARDAEMTVLEQRPELLAWYGRRGWQSTGETEPFPYGNPRFGLPRRPDLRFLVLAKSLRAIDAPPPRGAPRHPA